MQRQIIRETRGARQAGRGTRGLSSLFEACASGKRGERSNSEGERSNSEGERDNSSRERGKTDGAGSTS
jgi:hypothetical protein